METARFCTDCGTVLTMDGKDRPYCPGCVLRMGLEKEPPPGASPATMRAPPPPPEELQPFFERLEIQEPLGRGGMGWVYRAWQRDLERPVALKILPADFTDQEGFKERFQREARAMARLSHPHIVGVHEYGEAGDHVYLVMEYVDGVNLRAVIKDGPVPVQDALGMVSQICTALEYAHRQGVVHRDVKPENVLIDKSGTVKMADFGLARLVGDLTGEPHLTASHQVLGTPHYMAPEQWESPSSVDQRADLYGLGVMTYELLTGELPLGRFDPPSAKAAVDQRVDQIVLRALDKSPDRRFQTAAEMQEAVVNVARQPAHPVPSYGQTVPGPRPVAVAKDEGSVGMPLILHWLLSGAALIVLVATRVEPVALWVGASVGVILPLVMAILNVGRRVAWSYLGVGVFTLTSFLLAVVLIPQVAMGLDYCLSGDPFDFNRRFNSDSYQQHRYSVQLTREVCGAMLGTLLGVTALVVIVRRVRPIHSFLSLFRRSRSVS